jgi:hypothetical protein
MMRKAKEAAIKRRVMEGMADTHVSTQSANHNLHATVRMHAELLE